LYAAAEAADSKWVDPVWMRAALAYRRSRLAAGDPAAMRKWVGVGLGHADRAVAVDPNSPDAYELRGSLRYWSYLQTLEPDAAHLKTALATAKADLEKSTTLNSAQAGAYAVLSHLYNFAGTPQDVAIAAQRALEADEFQAQANLVLQRLFNASYDMGQFDKAEQYCNTARERFPADFRAVRCRLYLLTMTTKTPEVDKAKALADSVVAMVAVGAQPRERLTENMLYAAVLARASKQRPELADSARRLVKASEGTAQNDPSRDLAYFGAFVHTLLGDKDEALRLLKIYLVASPQQVLVLRGDPGWWFRDLAADPRYKQLVGGP
jgi:serine/threonine-protein kinase